MLCEMWNLNDFFKKWDVEVKPVQERSSRVRWSEGMAKEKLLAASINYRSFQAPLVYTGDCLGLGLAQDVGFLPIIP